MGSRTPESAERRIFFYGLALLIGISAIFWAGYLIAQPRFDPGFEEPAFDAAYYLDWSDAILGDRPDDPRFSGAFYRAPLYPYLLSLLRGVGAGLPLIYAIQLALALAVTGWLAFSVFGWAGRTAGWSVALLLGAYHPWLFFSSRLLAESWAIEALLIALTLVPRRSSRAAVGAGLFAGIATLARPNLLLVPIGWAALAWWRGERRKALQLLGTLLLVLIPITLVNGLASGHFVPVSANGGLTLYHGNGPGALGVFTPPAGMGAELAAQRFEATAVASQRAGSDLDPVEADRYWGAQAVAARLDAPWESVTLVWNRLLLCVGSDEIALDEAPALDPNPRRWFAAVPFWLLLGLASAGAFAGRRWSGASWSWIAVIACAATPLIFYVSSRYRLPLAVLLTVPAGIGLARIVERKLRPLLIAAIVSAISLTAPWLAEATMPYAAIARSERASGHAALAHGYHDRSLAAASQEEREHWSRLAVDQLEQGRADGEGSVEWLFAAGTIAATAGRTAEAHAAWLRAWQSRGSPGTRVSAAANLAAGWVESGRPVAAVDLMRQAVELVPLHATCWNNLVVALAAAGRSSEARAAIDQARRLGVPLNPELVATFGGDEGSR